MFPAPRSLSTLQKTLVDPYPSPQKSPARGSGRPSTPERPTAPLPLDIAQHAHIFQTPRKAAGQPPRRAPDPHSAANWILRTPPRDSRALPATPRADGWVLQTPSTHSRAPQTHHRADVRALPATPHAGNWVPQTPSTSSRSSQVPRADTRAFPVTPHAGVPQTPSTNTRALHTHRADPRALPATPHAGNWALQTPSTNSRTLQTSSAHNQVAFPTAPRTDAWAPPSPSPSKRARHTPHTDDLTLPVAAPRAPDTQRAPQTPSSAHTAQWALQTPQTDTRARAPLPASRTPLEPPESPCKGRDGKSKSKSKAHTYRAAGLGLGPPPCLRQKKSQSQLPAPLPCYPDGRPLELMTPQEMVADTKRKRSALPATPVPMPPRLLDADFMLRRARTPSGSLRPRVASTSRPRAPEEQAREPITVDDFRRIEGLL